MKKSSMKEIVARPGGANLPKFASILIVEDQRFDRARLRRLIDELEFDTHVAEASRLEEMSTQLQIDKFDLVLLDYNLPDGNGLLALDAIRYDAKNRNAAVIMITGDGQTELAIEALKRGCSDYITKDDLTSASFQRAAINALQKSSLTIGIETQENKRQDIEAVLEKFSSECAGEIKPVVSRMMRQLRDLRDASNLSPEQSAERHARIERSCMRLWEFLNDLEAYSGTDLAIQAAKDAGLAVSTPEPLAHFGPPPHDDMPPPMAEPLQPHVVPRKPARGLFGRLRN